jgi:ribosome biogenesis GTPase
MEGLVTRTTGSWYRILSDGKTFDCRLRGNYRLRGNKQTNPVAVGDHVEFLLQDDGSGMINNVLDRRNYIVRKATKLSKQTHVIASNIDLLCVVASLAFPRTSTGFIDRLLVTAEAYHIPACIIFNKADLYDDELMESLSSLKNLYGKAGYPVLVTSAMKGSGIEQLKKSIHGKTVLFSGHSGVGKSALLNAIEPSLNLRMGEVSEWSEKGKHTTTFAEIFPLPASNAFLIDTPGIKEFGMVDIKPEELGHFFPEIRSLLHGCRFNTCTHTHEPGCAVKQAVDDGSLAEERYTNYIGILNQIQEDEA